MKFFMQKGNNRRGFTLLESVLYIALAAIILYAVSSLYGVVIVNEVRNDSHASVDDGSLYAMHLITDAVRRAQSVATPAHQSIDGDLVLHMADAAIDPTHFFLSSSTIMMQEGAGAAVAITPPSVAVSGLQFENLSQNAVSDSVHIQFDAEYYHSAPQEAIYSDTYYGAATTK